ncbi:ureidoglycolate lyase [Aminobacter sp. MDW-2]|uniref:ureidoglycolate lyase n=1 Tax=Aminobacter sp. MDW-2 TaxID=2666139 RepID=UPI00163C11A0|nr:ureidoglycolate lyase [Aminobacter sp. MDW-2]QNH36880.1 ureidoglycolate lyase [Aminobacter sp. MDW-2]WMC95356.1 ureidoglycolate lyase [Aminobacter aminovorans]
MARCFIPVQPLSRDGFAPYGDVIDAGGPESFPTNGGAAHRFHRLGVADCGAEGGAALLSIFRVLHAGLPPRVKMMERHPLSSQAFIPLAGQRFVVIVAPAQCRPDPEMLRAFVTDGRQGVNYHRATWHHPLVALDGGDFLVVDRDGPGPDFNQDYEEVFLSRDVLIDMRAVEAALSTLSPTSSQEQNR